MYTIEQSRRPVSRDAWEQRGQVETMKQQRGGECVKGNCRILQVETDLHLEPGCF